MNSRSIVRNLPGGRHDDGQIEGLLEGRYEANGNWDRARSRFALAGAWVGGFKAKRQAHSAFPMGNRGGVGWTTCRPPRREYHERYADAAGTPDIRRWRQRGASKWHDDRSLRLNSTVGCAIWLIRALGA